MHNKRYDGYRAYQYLEPSDYPQTELVPQLDRVPSRKVVTSAEQEGRVEKIFAEHLIVSLHDHCFVALQSSAQLHLGLVGQPRQA